MSRLMRVDTNRRDHHNLLAEITSVATVGTPDHNNWLPPAFASYEPHHDQGFNRPSSSLQRPRPQGSGPGTSRAKTRRTLKLRNSRPEATPIINQALMSELGVGVIPY